MFGFGRGVRSETEIHPGALLICPYLFLVNARALESKIITKEDTGTYMRLKPMRLFGLSVSKGGGLGHSSKKVRIL